MKSQCECGHPMHVGECEHCDCTEPREDLDVPTAENWQRLSASSILQEVDDRVSSDAAEYWNGCGQEVRDEIAIFGQRHGVGAATEEVEELAK